jgi:uncharacterized protein
MQQQAIIIFVRNPEKGKVKTRLAKDIGEEAALEVYKNLLLHTYEVVTKVECDRFVFYTDHINQHDMWSSGLFYKMLQQGEDLGSKMIHSFTELFQLGYSSVIIIGSDCPGLQSQHIEDAFGKLDHHELVLGPSLDGGYYLLGLTKLIPIFFHEKKWSTDTVLQDTLTDADRLQVKVALLPHLQDIDVADDLKDWQQLLKNNDDLSDNKT